MELINGRTAEEIKRWLRWVTYRCDQTEDRCETCEYRDDCGEYCGSDTYKEALALIERLEAEQPRWISVKDRLPEKGDNVLISLCGCNVKQAVYRGDGVFEAAYADTYHSTDLGSIVLTHWMPTPKPMEVSE